MSAVRLGPVMNTQAVGAGVPASSGVSGYSVLQADSLEAAVKLAQGGDARTLAQGMDGVEIAEAR